MTEMPRTRSQVVTELERKLSRTWAQATMPDANWQVSIPLGIPEVVDAPGMAAEVERMCALWSAWAAQHDVELVHRRRTVLGRNILLPVRLVVNNPAEAARIVGGSWPARFEHEAWQRHVLETEFAVPDEDAMLVLKRTRTMDEVDFALLVEVGRWLRDHSVQAGKVSARQVPVPGIHAKWVITHAPLLELLLGKGAGLPLVDTRFRAVHFTYLDQVHRATPGARLHDSTVLGTPMSPAYLPEVVIISENLETAILFPELAHAVSVQGQGSSGAEKMYEVDWIRNAPRVLYWGDLDAQGFEILDAYRANGLAVSSVLMDLDALHQYASQASWRDAGGHQLVRQPRHDLRHLNKAERTCYRTITDPQADACIPIRIEQERIPLDDALIAVQRTLRR